MTGSKIEFWGIEWQKYDKRIKRYERAGEMFHTQKELLETAKRKGWAIVRRGSSRVYHRINPATGKIAHIRDGRMVVPDHHNLPRNMAVIVGDNPQLAKPKKVKSPTISQRSPRYTVKVRDYCRRPPK